MKRRGRYALLIPPILSLLLELLGIAAIAWGFLLLAPFAGAIAAGVGLVLVGVALDPPSRNNQKSEATE